MFGMSESEYHFIMNTFVEPLKKEKLEVYFFGSCTRGENKKYSDLDIVLVNVGSRKTFVSELIEQITINGALLMSIIHRRINHEGYKKSYRKCFKS